MKLTIGWDAVLGNPVVRRHVREITRYSRSLFGGYLDRAIPTDHKVIKDAVWGVVSLSPLEWFLMDSPLLQRLRFVRQLGTSYLVYPTAGYSRFEHSIGATHAVHDAAVAIRHNAEVSGKEGEVQDALKYVPLIRLAALLHDTGHGPFSHVSERFVQESDDGAAELLGFFRDELDEDYGLAEIYSALLCVSEPLRSFLDARESITLDGPVSEALASMILGVPPARPKYLFAAQLISSIYDVDRVDYMLRDSHLAQVPLPLDVRRLFSKYQLRRVLASRLPLPLDARGSVNSEEQLYVLGTGESGAGCLDELYLSRVWLYDRLYLHHKTRVAEEVLIEALRAITQATRKPARELMQMTDEDVLRFPAMGRHKPHFSSLSRRLRTRNLPVRAFTFAPRHLGRVEPVTVGAPRPSEADEAEDANVKTRRIKLEEAVESAEACRRLLDLIHETYVVICRTLKQKVACTREDLFLCRFGSKVVMKSAVPFLFPHDESDSVRAYDKLAFVAPERWAEAYMRRKDAGYIFSPKEARTEVALACEVAFFDLLGAQFSPEARSIVKLNFSGLTKCKRDLDKRGFYDTRRALRPIPQQLESVSGKELISRLVQTYGAFDRAADGGIWRAHEQIPRFLAQFPDSLATEMGEVLADGFYYTKDMEAEKIVACAEGLAESLRSRKGETVLLCPLGELKDSASHFSRSVSQVIANRDGLQVVAPWSLNTIQDGTPVIFFDDVLSTGSQCVDIFASWASLQRTGSLGEKRESSIVNRDKLARLKTGFAFLFATDAGQGKVREFWEGQFESKPLVCCTQPLEKIYGQLKAHEQLRTFLADVGKQLLKSTKGKVSPKKWDAKRIEECSLGYGNHEVILVFPYNPPTVTLTALWSKGKYNGGDWVPLFPRVDKK